MGVHSVVERNPTVPTSTRSDLLQKSQEIERMVYQKVDPVKLFKYRTVESEPISCHARARSGRMSRPQIYQRVAHHHGLRRRDRRAIGDSEEPRGVRLPRVRAIAAQHPVAKVSG